MLLEKKNDQSSEPSDQKTPDTKTDEPKDQPTEPKEPEKKDQKPDERDKIISVQFNKIRSMEERLNNLSAQIDESRKPPPPSKDDLSKEFYEDPVAVLRREIQESIAPIKEAISRRDTETEYDRLKRQFKSHPNPVIRDGITKFEQYVDQLMTKVDVNEANLTNIIYGVIGAAAAGDIEDPSPSQPATQPTEPEPTQPTSDRMNQLPPHLRPSAPTPPTRGKPKKQYRELTETEKRIARENKLTPEQYLEALDIDGSEVVNTDFSKLGQD